MFKICNYNTVALPSLALPCLPNNYLYHININYFRKNVRSKMLDPVLNVPLKVLLYKEIIHQTEKQLILFIKNNLIFLTSSSCWLRSNTMIILERTNCRFSKTPQKAFLNYTKTKKIPICTFQHLIFIHVWFSVRKAIKTCFSMIRSHAAFTNSTKWKTWD